MLNLKQLLIYVDNFSKNALRSLDLVKLGQSYSPDDQEDYGLDLWEMAGETAGKAFSDPLVLLSKMYDKAKEVGGGYAAIYKALQDFNNEYYTEINRSPYKDMVNDLIDKVQNDLMRRAGGAEGLSKPDSPEVISELKNYWKELDTGISKQTLEGEPEEAVNEDAGSAAKASEAAATPHRIAAEINKYHGLKAITDDPAIEEKINKLIPILNNYKFDVEAIDELEKQQILQSESPDPELAEQIEPLRIQIDKSRREIARIKLSIRDHELQNKSKELQTELQTTLSTDERLKLQEKIDYYNLLSSGLIGTREETSKRRALLKLMKTRMPSPDELKTIKEEINAAAKKRRTLEEYHAMQQAKNLTLFAPPAAGTRKRVALGLAGLTHTLGMAATDQLRTAINSNIKNIKDQLAPMLKPYMDAFDAAKQTNDLVLQKAAAAKITEATKKIGPQLAAQLPNIKVFEEKIKELRVFNNACKRLVPIMTNNDPLDEKSAGHMSQLLELGKRLEDFFVKSPEKTDPIIFTLRLIIAELSAKLSPAEQPQSKQIETEATTMNKEDRKIALAKLLKKAEDESSFIDHAITTSKDAETLLDQIINHLEEE